MVHGVGTGLLLLRYGGGLVHHGMILRCGAARFVLIMAVHHVSLTGQSLVDGVVNRHKISPSVFVAARTIPQVQRNCYSADRTNSHGKMPLPVVKTEAPVQWPTAVIENGAVIFSGNFSQKFYFRMFSSLFRIAIYLPAALRNLLPQDIQSFPPYQFVPHKLIPPHSILSVISSACMGAAS